jgi:threonine 3-dehydrogenase
VMNEIGMSEGFDVGLEMSCVPVAFRDMLSAMNHGGKIAMLGIPAGDMAIDWSQVIFKGLIIKGIYGREMFETWYKMASLIQSGLDLSPIITHQFKVDEFQQGFDTMGSGESGKVILNWQ